MSEKVKKLKKRICKNGHKVEVAEQKLWFEGKELDDDLTLGVSGLEAGSELLLYHAGNQPKDEEVNGSASKADGAKNGDGAGQKQDS